MHSVSVDCGFSFVVTLFPKRPTILFHPRSIAKVSFDRPKRPALALLKILKSLPKQGYPPIFFPDNMIERNGSVGTFCTFCIIYDTISFYQGRHQLYTNFDQLRILDKFKIKQIRGNWQVLNAQDIYELDR